MKLIKSFPENTYQKPVLLVFSQSVFLTSFLGCWKTVTAVASDLILVEAGGKWQFLVGNVIPLVISNVIIHTDAERTLCPLIDKINKYLLSIYFAHVLPKSWEFKIWEESRHFLPIKVLHSDMRQIINFKNKQSDDSRL